MKTFFGLATLLFLAPVGHGATEVRTLVVFPFENQSARSDVDWISESFAETLSSRLADPNRYVLGREERKVAYEQLELPPDTPLTLASEYKVAEILGVDWAVVGNFEVGGDRLTAREQLLDMRRLRLLPALEATGALSDLVDLETRLAWRLLATSDPDFTVGQEEDFRRLFHELRLDAFENYIRGILATDPESRVHFLREANRLDPEDHRAAFELGRSYFAEKDYSNSALWLRGLKDGDAHYLESLFLLAVDEYFLGRDPSAERAFAAAAGQIPLNEVSNNLGVMQARRKDFPAALASIKRAYQGDPSDPDYSFNVAVCLSSLKRYVEAIKFLEETLRANDEDAEAHTLLALALGKVGKTEEQQRVLQWLTDHEGGVAPDPPEDFIPEPRLKKNYDGRAFRLLALKVHNEEERRLASLPNAQHGEAHLANGKRLLAAGRPLEAERELAEAMSLLPDSGEAHLLLGQVYAAEGRPRQAEKELETSLKLENSVAAHLGLARVYLALSQPEPARFHARAAEDLDPGNREAAGLMEELRSPRLPSLSGKKP